MVASARAVVCVLARDADVVASARAVVCALAGDADVVASARTVVCVLARDADVVASTCSDQSCVAATPTKMTITARSQHWAPGFHLDLMRTYTPTTALIFPAVVAACPK